LPTGWYFLLLPFNNNNNNKIFILNVNFGDPIFQESNATQAVLDIVLFELRFPDTHRSLSQYEPLLQLKEEKRRSSSIHTPSPAPEPSDLSGPQLVVLREDPRSPLAEPSEEPAVQRRPPKPNHTKSHSGQLFDEDKDAQTETLRTRVRQSLTHHLSWLLLISWVSFILFPFLKRMNYVVQFLETELPRDRLETIEA